MVETVLKMQATKKEHRNKITHCYNLQLCNKFQYLVTAVFIALLRSYTLLKKSHKTCGFHLYVCCSSTMTKPFFSNAIRPSDFGDKLSPFNLLVVHMYTWTYSRQILVFGLVSVLSPSMPACKNIIYYTSTWNFKISLNKMAQKTKAIPSITYRRNWIGSSIYIFFEILAWAFHGQWRFLANF